MNRRHFLHQTGAALGSTALTPLHRSLAAVVNEPRRAATLEKAYKQLGFDPHAGDSFTALWMADIHYGGGKPEDILPPMIAEIAPMNPRPAFIGIVGDLICAASRSFGTVPSENDRKIAVEEYRAMKPHYEELARLAPVKLTLGNHDTYPGEDDLGLFRSVYGDTPVTHAFETKGVPFIIANGGSCGLLGAAQQAWFCDQVKKLHRPGGTLITAVHQPSVGSIVRERGITSAVRAAFAEARGKLWLIGGHEHENRDRQFAIPRGENVMNAWITAGNRTSWGKENPGYWVWCFSAGRLVGRIFRHVGDAAGYTLSAPEVTARAAPLFLPFETQADLLWKVLVGEGDEPYRRTTKAAWCLNYWTYVRQLDYEFPLSLAKGKAKRCVVLMASISDKPTGLSVSANGKAWDPIENSTERNGSYVTFTIPQSCLDVGTLSLRMTECAVSGFALTA
jgi:hypothetical protein